ncbi:hypothetical protein [Paraburkholderia caribensis]|uniref:hypothetical protein n=1 Tax=Paraburkholderia caribensis TaxID=75105 RepID=UPI0011E02A38|nr:hypothetical protein [Paraburkholderia caribensis]
MFEKWIRKYAVFWLRHCRKIAVAVCILVTLSAFHLLFRAPNLDPYVTYERQPDGTWKIYEEYRVVESPYVYYRSAATSSADPHDRDNIPGCRPDPTMAGEAWIIMRATIEIPSVGPALSTLKSLEVSQLLFSYYLHGWPGKLFFSDRKNDVASCRDIEARLPQGAEITSGDVLALTKIETTESYPSTVACNAYEWHPLPFEKTDPPCGDEYVERPVLLKSNGHVVGAKTVFRNWLQDEGVDRCARISVPFIPPPGWVPPVPSGTICHPFQTEGSPNLPVGII